MNHGLQCNCLGLLSLINRYLQILNSYEVTDSCFIIYQRNTSAMAGPLMP